MYECESWTVKKAEGRRIDDFELWCWRRLLRVLPWTARRSNQSILNQSWILIGRTDTEVETPVLWPPDVKNWLTRKDPDAGKDWRWEEHEWNKDNSTSLLQRFSSVTQSCLTICDPMNHSTPGLPVHHQLPEFTQTHVHRVSDAIQPSHPLGLILIRVFSNESILHIRWWKY